MQADQAAGLRRNPAKRSAQVVSVFSAQSDWATRLAKGLQTHGSRVLLVDTTGRHAPPKTQSIFGWEAQVARQCLQPVSVAGIDWLHAPGAAAGDAAIVQASAGRDYVLFDGGRMQSKTLMLDASVAQTLVVEVSDTPEVLCNVYAFVKTLYLNKRDTRVILCGQAGLCERVISATHQFLRVRPAWLEMAPLEADAHLTALAAKISATEIGTSRFYNNAGGEGLQHG